MKYFIRRTSDWSEDVAPHTNAIQVEVEWWDCRTFKTFEEHDKEFPGESWLSRGTNHVAWREGSEAGIKRQIGTIKVWTIEIPELTEFVKKVGKIILFPPDMTYGKDALCYIEIYGDYRE